MYHLRHQDFKSTFGIHYACDAVYALFQTPLAVCSQKFLLEVSYLGIPVQIQMTDIFNKPNSKNKDSVSVDIFVNLILWFQSHKIL